MNNLEISGKITQLLTQSGVSKNTGNPWEVQTAIITTNDVYPKTVAVEVYGVNKIAELALKEGEDVTLSLNLESRESNGRWFTSARAWRVTRGAAQMPPAGLPTAAPYGQPAVFPQPAARPAADPAAQPSTVLPF